MLLNSGSGNDTLNLTSGTFSQRARITTGSGQDAVNLNTVNFDGDIGVNTGADDDTLDFQTVVVQGTTSLASSRGGDDLVMNGSTFSTFALRTGSGGDTGQFMNTNVTGRAVTSLGSAVDTLDFDANVVFSGVSVFNGGFGSDSFDGFMSNFTQTKRFGSVETQNMVADDLADQAATENAMFSFTVPTAGFSEVADTPTFDRHVGRRFGIASLVEL